MVEVKIGNIFESNKNTLVNTVNCVGVMGKGIALEYKKKYPEMFKEYKNLCTEQKIKPGVPYLFEDLFGTSIINFPTKNHWRSPSKLDDIKNGLKIFIQKYEEWGIKSIAFPPLGCGNGGLSWEVVGPMMFSELKKLNIPVEIYAPYGTSKEQLKSDFLNNDVINNNINSRQNIKLKLNPNWITILETIYQLSSQRYANPVGRTIFQKICFTLTELGIETGFVFTKGSYGPFSQDIKPAISSLANSNLIIEKNLGKMTSIALGPEYESFRAKNIEFLNKYSKEVHKTIDLFSRVKNTEQAEEISTVLFAVVNMKKNNPDISETDVLDYITNWKKNWASGSKVENVASTIRNLGMLRWINLKYSQRLPIPSQDIF